VAYAPTFESIQMHPLPDWFADCKLGIFVHWGLYSVPGWAASNKSPFALLAEGGFEKYFRENPYAEWYLNSLKFDDGPTREYHDRTLGPDFAYEDFQPIFEEESRKWVAQEWADLFQRAGAAYVVFTAKHTDGYLLWPSEVGNLERPGYASRRDLVGELAEAVRSRGLRLGLYYTGGMDWLLNPERIDAPEKIYSTILRETKHSEYADAHWRELIHRYRPSVLWGDIMYPETSNVAKLFADYYNTVEDGVVNDRFATSWTPPRMPGLQPPGEHYDFLTPEYIAFDDIQEEKWETCRGISNSFGYNRNDDEGSYLTADAVIRIFIDIVSKNGNLLLNVGPRADGTIHELQRRCLLGLGAWLDTNGEAVRGTRPWKRASSTTEDGIDVRFTQREGTLYALLLGRPKTPEVRIRDLTAAPGSTARWLGTDADLSWEQHGTDLTVRVPDPIPEQAAHALRFTASAS
jgi:alpha-L-fucosidase